jgi:hypothetical protein
MQLLYCLCLARIRQTAARRHEDRKTSSIISGVRAWEPWIETDNNREIMSETEI